MCVHVCVCVCVCVCVSQARRSGAVESRVAKRRALEQDEERDKLMTQHPTSQQSQSHSSLSQEQQHQPQQRKRLAFAVEVLFFLIYLNTLLFSGFLCYPLIFAAIVGLGIFFIIIDFTFF